MFACLSVVWIAAEEIWWDGTGAEPKPESVEKPRRTPRTAPDGSFEIAPPDTARLDAARERARTMDRTAAPSASAVGYYGCAGGWLVQVSARGPMGILITAYRVDHFVHLEYYPTGPDGKPALPRDWRRIGEKHQVDLTVGAMNDGALFFREGDDTLEVHVGTLGSDIIRASESGTRRIIIGLGGDDQILTPNEEFGTGDDSPAEAPNESGNARSGTPDSATPKAEEESKPTRD